MRTSLWFLPLVFVLAAIAGAEAMLYVDEFVYETPDQNLPHWLFTGGATAAFNILSIVANSMATVVSLVISMTMVTFTLASSQYGPRLLRNFIGDQRNQSMLGLFVGTYVFSMMILRQVKDLEDTTFIPALSITLATFLSILSFIVLIYLVHHVAVSLRVETLSERIGCELNTQIERLYPDSHDDLPEHWDHAYVALNQNDTSKKDAAPTDESAPPPYQDNTKRIEEADKRLEKTMPFSLKTGHAGYLQSIDEEALLNLAVEKNMVIKVVIYPSEFVLSQQIIAELYVQDDTALQNTEATPEEAQNKAEFLKSLLDCFSIGRHRNPTQDIEFSIDQLVEIALVALSPGVNKPFTAVNCIDRLAESLSMLTRRYFPPAYLTKDDTLRLVMTRLSYKKILDTCLGQIQYHSQNHPWVRTYLTETMTKIKQITDNDAIIDVIDEMIEEGNAKNKLVTDS